MIRLIGFEFGKILKRKIVLAAFIMLAVFGIMLYMGDGPQGVISRLPDGTYIGGGEAIAYDKQVAAEYEGILTEEKARSILERFAPGTQDGGLWTVNSIYNAVQHFFGNLDGSWNGLTVEEAFPDYQGEEPLILGYTDGYTGFIMMGMYLMVTLGFVLITALSPVFSEEYSRRTDALILTARYGKSRCSRAKQIRNVVVVWLLTGFWHGAAWNFIFWGAYFALLLLGERYVWKRALSRAPAAVQHLYTMVLVIFSWVLFRCESLSAVGSYVSAMFGFGGGMGQAVYFLKQYGVFLLIGVIASLPVKRWMEGALRRRGKENLLEWGAALLGLLLLGLSFLQLISSTFNPFIYFRF